MGDGDRRGDWEKGVDENLASLNAGQRVWEHEQKLVRKVQADHDRIMRGDPERDTDGLIARLHNEENKVAMLEAVVLKDKAGGKGLSGRVQALEDRERTADTRLKVWIALIGLLSAILVAVVSNLDRIERFMGKESKDPVHQAIERAKRPRKKKYVIRVVPQTEQPTPPPEETP
jgi:hypothetical protein